MEEVLDEHHDTRMRRYPHIVSPEPHPECPHTLIPDALSEAIEESSVRILTVDI